MFKSLEFLYFFRYLQIFFLYQSNSYLQLFPNYLFDADFRRNINFPSYLVYKLNDLDFIHFKMKIIFQVIIIDKKQIINYFINYFIIFN